MKTSIGELWESLKGNSKRKSEMEARLKEASGKNTISLEHWESMRELVKLRNSMKVSNGPKDG